MKKIEILPENVIDQIKAGEVIERPAHLAKELIENALDAEATKISLIIEDNGLKSFQIKDNGNGIDFEHLPLAFCRHATSKLERFSDIFKLESFGFRGEALASIAAISKVTCHTQTKDGEGGTLQLEGGQQVVSQKQNHQERGTTLIIRDLFFNTPARLKFVRSQASEKYQLQRIVYAFLLTYPHVEFEIQYDDKPVKRYLAHGKDDYEKRFADVFLKKRPDSVKVYANKTSLYHFQLLTMDHDEIRSSKQKFIFVNNRLVQDKTLTQIIQNRLPEGEAQKAWALFLFCPPNEIDVNVHPNKTFIKYLKPSFIFSLIEETLKTKAPKNPKNFPAGSPQKSKKDFSSSLFPVGNNLHLFEKDQDVYLFSWKIFLEDLLARSSEESLPLMISEYWTPQEEVSGDFLSEAKKKGFELELYQDSSYLIKTIPVELSQVPGDKLASLLDYYLAKTLSKSQNQLEEWDSESLESLVAGLSSLEKRGIKGLDKKFFENFFSS